MTTLRYHWYVLLPADEQILSTCNASIHKACEVLKVPSMECMEGIDNEEGRSWPFRVSTVTDTSPQTGATHSNTSFIYLIVLPTLNATLYEALVVNLPQCGNVLDCIHADTDYTNNIVEKLSTIIQNDEIRHVYLLGNDMIYRVSYSQ